MGVVLSTIALKVDFLGIHNYDSYKKWVVYYKTKYQIFLSY